MPFGGGTHICPGKNFAKLVNFLTVALLITKYDFQNLANRASMEMSMRNFGFGTLSPAEKVPVMIRQRAGM